MFKKGKNAVESDPKIGYLGGDSLIRATYQKGKIGSNKARREASRNEFMEIGGMPNRVKSFREIKTSEERPRARPGFVKPIRNGLRKVQSLI